MVVNRILFSFLILISGLDLFGQQILDFDKLSIDNGFTSSKANAIIQDKKGFIWIGTWNGLNKYDGYECVTYRPSYHDTTTISNREVLALLEDRFGYIWIGTTSGLNRINPETNELRRYKFQNRIISLFEDSKNNIWVGTWNGGIYKLDPTTGETSNYFPNDIISYIYEDSRNMFWIATYYGLINFDPLTSGFVRYLPSENNARSSISHSVVTQIAESSDGALWIGTWGGGLNKLIVRPNRDSLQFIHYRSHEGSGSLTSDMVYRMFFDNYRNLWIGTWDAGLNLLDPDQQTKSPEVAKFHCYKSDLSEPYSISGNNITALFVDRSGVLWVGSSKIDRTNIIKTGFTRYKTLHFSEGVYTENTVRAFSVYNDILCVGARDGIKIYKRNKESYVFFKDINKLSYHMGRYNYNSNIVISTLMNKDGLWVGTEDAGLIFFPGQSAIEKRNSDFLYFNTRTNPRLPGNKICNLVQSKKYPGIIWVGDMQNGFAQLSYNNNGQVSIETFRAGYNDKSLSDNNIRSIVEDQNGLVWIGTQNGLNCFDPEKKTFKKFFSSISDSNSINDNVINVIYEDSSDNLWIGTNMGLNKKQIKELSDGSTITYFKGYPDYKYLNNENITNILEDDSQNLWIGLYRGMIKFNKVDETIVKEYFTKEYQHIVVERNSAIKSNDGMFLFGGANGFISFYPDSLLKYSLPPKACITDLLISNESINSKSKLKRRKQFTGSISYAESIHLTYKDKILTFVFSAMDFKEPKKNTYAYLLEGFDSDWNEVGARNTATYTNIRPGKYIFKVRAANSDGIWSEEPASIKLFISPPWWKTKFAYVIYVLILIALLYFFNQYSLIEVREKGRIMIEHVQYEKEHELNELKALFFTNITHEFRTPLTLIQGPAEELLRMKELPQNATRQAELIQRNSQRLLRLVNQLMEFRKVEKGKMELYPQKCDILALLNDLYDSFKSMADSKSIDFILTFKTPEIFAIVDIEKFEKVMFNLVSNAFKYCEDGGKISIWVGIESVNTADDTLIIEVEDTGIGIAHEHKEKVFERFFQVHRKHTQSTGGIGLYLSRAFIELHSGRIELESELGKGSCFKVLLPVNRVAVTQEDAKPSFSGEIFEDRIADDSHLQIPLSKESINKFNNSGDNKSPKVIIVEDDSELNEFLISGLSPDFNVVGTFNGREALEMARKLNPDIILTDIMMPEMDGIELCKLLRKDLATSHIPVVFLTAKTMREDEIEGLKIGAVDYIYKPFNLISLKLKIQNILDNRKSLHERIRADQLMEPELIELSSLDEKFLKDAVDAVNKYLDDPSFDVEKFSHVIGISTNQAYRKIKALTGQTAKEFIRNQRLKTAATLFLQKKRSISEIIYMVGFSSPSYFTRCFREYYDCTPKEYIEKDGKN